MLDNRQFKGLIRYVLSVAYSDGDGSDPFHTRCRGDGHSAVDPATAKGDGCCRHKRRTRRGALNRLGCALQVGFLRMTGRQSNSVRVLPQPLLAHLG